MAKRGRFRKPLEPGIYGSWQVIKPLSFKGTSRSLCQCIHCGKVMGRTNTEIRLGWRCHCVAHKGIAGRPKDLAKRQAVLEMRQQQRLSYSAIGERLGVSRERVRQLLAESGADGSIGLTTGCEADIDIQLMKQLLDAGWSFKRTGRRLGVCGTTVKKRAIKEGVFVSHASRIDAQDLGRVHGYLVVKRIERRPGCKQRVFVCLCDSALGGCGSTHTVVKGNFERTKSCGCFHRKPRKKAMPEPQTAGLPV